MFGLIVIAFDLFMALIMYMPGSEIRVNGVEMPYEQFVSLPMPKILIGAFAALGIYLIVLGLIKMYKKKMVQKLGKETYGVVTDLMPSNIKVRGRCVLKAIVQVVNDGYVVNQYCDEIDKGKTGDVYFCGSFVKVKHYKNDISIVKTVPDAQVPFEIADVLTKRFEQLFVKVDDERNDEYDEEFTNAYVVFNGCKYRRK
jgi:hypothetical protein